MAARSRRAPHVDAIGGFPTACSWVRLMLLRALNFVGFPYRRFCVICGAWPRLQARRIPPTRPRSQVNNDPSRARLGQVPPPRTRRFLREPVASRLSDLRNTALARVARFVPLQPRVATCPSALPRTHLLPRGPFRATAVITRRAEGAIGLDLGVCRRWRCDPCDAPMGARRPGGTFGRLQLMHFVCTWIDSASSFG